MNNKIFLPLAIILLLSGIAKVQHGYSQSHSDLQQKFEFDYESGLKKVNLQIEPNMEMIGFNFQSEISSGSLIMDIIDPNGKKEGGFVLQAVNQKSGAGNQIHINSGKNQNSHTHISGTGGQTIVTNSGGNTHQYVMHSGGGSSVGSMNKQVDNPIPGTWSVSIETKDLKGKLSLNMMQQGQE